MRPATSKLLLAVALTCGCGSEPDQDLPSEPAPEPTDWCERIVPGTPGTEQEMIAFANAHFAYRYFGVAERKQIDAPLIAAVAGEELDLDGYAAAAIDVCSLPAKQQTLGPASVELRGGVAWIKPGTGEVAIPEAAEAIAIDLRGLPNVAETQDALERATRASLDAPVMGFSSTVTAYMGHPDSWLAKLSGRPASSDIYQTQLVSNQPIPWPSSPTTARPIAVITDVAMPPAAARLALELRGAKRAILVGHSVMARVAEAEWRAIGARGLVIRTGTLDHEGEAIPDDVAADIRTDQPQLALETAAAIVAPSDDITGAAARLPSRVLDLYNSESSSQLETADLVGALVVAYGTTRGFFHVYDPWPANIDAAYFDALVDARKPVTKRYEARRVIERFAASLNDAHVYVSDLAYDATSVDVAGAIPVRFDMLDGEPVVATSSLAALHPGDTVIAVDGMPVAELLAIENRWISAATPLNRALHQALRLGIFHSPQRSFTLRAPNGTQRTEQVVAAGYNYPTLGPTRPSGWLTDLGAANVYYLNVNEAYGGATEAALLAKLDEARTGEGLVIDNRGYPGVDFFKLASAIAATTMVSPWFDTPAWKGASWFQMSPYQFTQPQISTAFAPPVAVIVGPWTQSAAEYATMLMMARADLKIVGRQTSGSNGNVTSVLLPGGFGMTFTGMRIRYANGSPFHGVGIPVSHPSSPTVEDLASGQDRELLDAIATLQLN
ncbi:MAG: S41 family peptidase [Kofleriaceae bacterium]